MELFYLTRNQMSELLNGVAEPHLKSPLTILQCAWAKTHPAEKMKGNMLGAVISTSLPPIFEKMIKMSHRDPGFSLNEIIALGNQIEYSHYSITSVQNWVKRDFKDLIQSPAHGKKYSLDQAALIFMIDDLKATLDFESIRKLLAIVFLNPQAEEEANLNGIRPLQIYTAYTSIFEELDQNNDQVLDLSGHESGKRNQDHILENLIKQKADEYAAGLEQVSDREREAISNLIFIAMLSVQTSYFQSMAKRFFNATLFLQNMS
ncbi:hypothetical protein BVG16_11835 [Paenibacillus selenitireducens]|uniref:DUF1836 domain-containing protein n=1 Tax=Paenibacillus selenitireducens TaxID=1324314 RepID=A0A1T2XF94_9BACL|nr:DUF1836 domain-containing protein [Paenibacillus selenitireducens]OPA78551.1 hypothetical protein BVG16_11835 [Paenibacillus selenitireducens]